MITKIQNLLSQVNTLIRKNNEILDATGSRFNIFGVLGVNHYENTHSAILAEFLNPKGSHALGDKLLVEFFKAIKLADFEFDTKHAKVTTELSGGENGRMDIVIESRGKAVIIENKIYAGDQWEQLKRYEDFAKKKYGANNFKIYYLTLWGNQASENSGDGVEYTQISYQSDIIAWLERCVMTAANYPMVRETLNQYINHIKGLTNQSMQNNMSQEITDYILATPERLESAFELAACLNRAKITIQQRFWHKLFAVCKENNLKIDNEQGFQSQIDSCVENFYTQSRNNKYYGISIIVGNLPTGELVRYDIKVQDNIYMGFVFDIDTKTDIAANYKHHQDVLKQHNHNFVSSAYFIGWKNTNPKLDFAYFSTDATRQIAEEKIMKNIVESIVQEVKDDIEFAKSKFQIK